MLLDFFAVHYVDKNTGFLHETFREYFSLHKLKYVFLEASGKGVYNMWHAYLNGIKYMVERHTKVLSVYNPNNCMWRAPSGPNVLFSQAQHIKKYFRYTTTSNFKTGIVFWAVAMIWLVCKLRLFNKQPVKSAKIQSSPAVRCLKSRVFLTLYYLH